MKPLMGHQEEEEEEKDATPSSSNTKDGKNNNDKANAMRSKHSVTEQRRRSKINERFQILRELIPHTDQKRDTASFLVEVIEYVQYLQAKVQKYEGGSYQPWNSEPTKLMPWRNSHWRMQSLPAHPHALKNGAGPEPTYLGRFDENPATLTCTMQPNAQNQNQFESHHPISDVQPFKAVDELPNKAIVTSVMPLGNAFSDAQPVSDECPDTVDALNHRDDLAIDGGTVSISSPYSQELLNSLTQALQTAGLDLSQASISLQINFGKRANRGSTSGQSMAKDLGNPPSSGNRDHYPEASNDEELDQAQKRLKI